MGPEGCYVLKISIIFEVVAKVDVVHWYAENQGKP